MKTNKLILLVIACITAISFTSCVEDGDFTVPQALGSEENEALRQLLIKVDNGTVSEISIANLKGLFVPGEVTEITSDIVVKGYVTSSDRSGNFFSEFFIQDSPSNPTAAIKVATDFRDSYNKYNVGREVYINLKGLYIGEVRSGDDVITIGGSPNLDAEVENLTLNQTNDMVLRSGNTEELVPLDVTFSEISDATVGMFVKVSDAQFPTSVAGLTYVDADDTFDTQRTLESCDGFGFTNFILETSTFADFAFSVIPSGGGSISAVVSKTFNGSDLVLALNEVTDVDMNGDRCSPLDINNFTVVFNEEFNDITTNWDSYSITGSETWSTTTFGNPGTAARMSGFNGSARTNEDWLVSVAIDLSASNDVFLIFETVKRFGGPDLELFMSTDYTGGDPTDSANGTWTSLDFVLDQNINDWSSWTSSGTVDLSSAAGGNVFIAFKYTSNTSEAATYQIDNLRVLEQ